MKSLKRIIPLSLLIMFCFLFLYKTTADAADESDFQTTVLYDGTVKITGYKGDAIDLTIPTTLDGKTVVEISSFTGSNTVKNLIISDSVKRIGEEAFWGQNLESVTFGSGLLYIDALAFQHCSNLKSISIPDNVKSIGADAFSGCIAVSSLNIGRGLKNIGKEAFSYLLNLNSLSVDPANTILSSSNNVLFNKSKTELLFYPSSDTATSYVVPNTVTEIEAYAFSGSIHLKSLTLSSNLEKIGFQAFRDCTDLVQLTLPSTVTIIGPDAFINTPWLDNQTDEFVIVNNGILIDYNGSGGDVIVPNTVTSLQGKAFSQCISLEKITLPSTIKSIGREAFYGCRNLKSVLIPNSVTRIEKDAFKSCTSLINITIPNSVVSIGERSFSNCKYLDNVVMSNSVKEIEDKAFYDTPWLNNQTQDYVIAGDGILLEYNGRATTLSLPTTIKKIGSYAFVSQGSLVSITIPEGVSSIANDAFLFCHSLESVTIPSTVTSIGDSAFYRCDNLKTIIIPEGVTSIAPYAFWSCESLESIRLPSTLTSIGSYAFENSKVLTSVVIPYSVVSIGFDSLIPITNNLTIYGASNSAVEEYAIDYNLPFSPYPTLLTSSSTASCISLSWNAVKDASGYEISRSTSETGPYTPLPLTNSTACSYTDSELTPQTTYYYKVRSYQTVNNTITYSIASNHLKVATTALQTMTLTSNSLSPSSIMLTWDKIAIADGYHIFRSASQNGSYENVATINNPSTVTFTNTPLSAGQIYYYKVSAYKGANQTAYEAASPVVMASTALYDISLTSRPISTKSIQLAWSRVASADGYQILQSTTQTGSYLPIATITNNTTLTYTHSGLGTGTVYYYRILAYKNVNPVTYEAVSAITKAATKPAQPKKLSYKADTTTTVKLTWSKVTHADGYQIFRSTSKNGSYKKVATLAGNRTFSYKNKGLSSGKLYYYKVRAYKNADQTAYGSNSSKVAAASKPNQIKKITHKSLTKTSVTLSWKKISNASGYQIYRSTSKKGKYIKVATASNKRTYYKNKGLKRGKTYYYKIRAYKTVGKTKVYATFSTIKTIKLKK